MEMTQARPNTISLVRKSTHWRDVAAGWHTWRVTGRCISCKKETTRTVVGTRLDASQTNLVCRSCDDAS